MLREMRWQVVNVPGITFTPVKACTKRALDFRQRHHMEQALRNFTSTNHSIHHSFAAIPIKYLSHGFEIQIANLIASFFV
jgi:hypothetical protein